MITELVLNRIKQLRLRRGYSEEYMGLCLDISQTAYSNLERGVTRLDLAKLEKIAEVLCVSLPALISGDTNETGLDSSSGQDVPGGGNCVTRPARTTPTILPIFTP